MFCTTLVKYALGATVTATSVLAQSDAWHFDIVKKLLVARIE
jgi:hypothetical protein